MNYNIEANLLFVNCKEALCRKDLVLTPPLSKISIAFGMEILAAAFQAKNACSTGIF
ncbi:MAG: hypothetical protein M0R48_04855 [Candidatus Omnitrophica bacterium]|nr:hypothetical protein [Candidatus Omnitrophota bacterium]